MARAGRAAAARGGSPQGRMGSPFSDPEITIGPVVRQVSSPRPLKENGMRKLFVAMAAVVAACGSSNPPPAAVSGTVAGSPFTASEAAALVVAPTTCSNIPGIGTAQVGAVGVAFSTSAGTCNFLSSLSAGQCAGRKDDRTVTVVIARLPLGGAASPVVGPGEYKVGASELALVPDLSTGLATVAFATAQKTDSACIPTTVRPTTAADGQAL